MTQPPSSGAPQPVQGVTGGPGLPQGVASVDGTTGNVQISPPNNTTQFKKGAVPQSLQVYEFDSGPTNFSRIAINAQTGGPFQLAVETAPSTVVRELDIIGTPVKIPNLQLTSIFQPIAGAGLTAAQWTDLPTSVVTLQIGVYLVVAELWATLGTAGAQIIFQIAPNSTGSSGTPNIIQGVIAIQSPVASNSIIVPLNAIINIATAGQYKIQGNMNTGVGNAGGRWSLLKIG